MSTCGTCRHFAKPIEEDGTCIWLASTESLFRKYAETDPSCSGHEVREPGIVAVPALTRKRTPRIDPLDILSPETRAKLARRDWHEREE